MNKFNDLVKIIKEENQKVEALAFIRRIQAWARQTKPEEMAHMPDELVEQLAQLMAKLQLMIDYLMGLGELMPRNDEQEHED